MKNMCKVRNLRSFIKNVYKTLIKTIERKSYLTS